MNRKLAAVAVSSLLLSGVSAGAQGVEIMRNGSRPTAVAPAERFAGKVLLDPLFGANGATRAGAGHVTFEPGARSAWHTHPAGQILIVTSGTGWVQEWGGEKREIGPGDVVYIPPAVKHWHGGTATHRMEHIAIQETIDGRNVD